MLPWAMACIRALFFRKDEMGTGIRGEPCVFNGCMWLVYCVCTLDNADLLCSTVEVGQATESHRTETA